MEIFALSYIDLYIDSSLYEYCFCIALLLAMLILMLMPFPDNASPESNLTLNCSFYMGEIAMSISKVSPRYNVLW